MLTSRILSLGAKSGIYSTCAPSIKLYGSVAGPVKKDVIKLEKNDAKVVGWVCNVRPEYRNSIEELNNKLKLNSMKECLQNDYKVLLI